MSEIKNERLNSLWQAETVKYNVLLKSPVICGDGVIHRWLVCVAKSCRTLLTAGPHVAENEPVPNSKLREQAVLYHLVQRVTRWTPQAAGKHGLI